MAQVQGKTRTGASLRIVFDNAVVSVPVSASTTFGDLARAVRGVSAQRHSHAAAIAVMFSNDFSAERTIPARAYELADLALSDTASGMTQANYNA